MPFTSSIWKLTIQRRSSISWHTPVVRYLINPLRENEWRERIPRTWPSSYDTSYEKFFQSNFGFVSYQFLVIPQSYYTPYWSARMTSCNLKPGGFLIPQPITQQSISTTCECGISFMKVKGFRQFLNNKRNSMVIYTSCQVPVWRFLRPSRSIHFGDVSEAWNNGALGLGNSIPTT